MTLPTVALSIRQPWAWLIVKGFKDIENRDWYTRFRGPVLIHAGKAWGADEKSVLSNLWCGTNPATGGSIDFNVPPDWTPQLGGIVGVAEIVSVTWSSPSPWFVGHYGFELRNARQLPFMPLKGQLGFFAATYVEPDRAP